MNIFLKILESFEHLIPVGRSIAGIWIKNPKSVAEADKVTSTVETVTQVAGAVASSVAAQSPTPTQAQ